MTLVETLIACGMTPPKQIVAGRFIRFPGCGKTRGNTAGWLRVITPTLAIYGDWSTGLSETWCDENHQDTEHARLLLAQARAQQREEARELEIRQQGVAEYALGLMGKATIGYHAYLMRKGFADQKGLLIDAKDVPWLVEKGVKGPQLVIPMRDVSRYDRVLSLQLIDEAGNKLFLPGGRAKRAIHRLGAGRDPKAVILCEGYATGLTLQNAVARFCAAYAVMVCFSAGNIEAVAETITDRERAIVCADHDESGRGEEAARVTGLKWVKPETVDSDFNDVHRQQGIFAVLQAVRQMF